MNLYRKIRNQFKQQKRYQKRLARLEKCGDFRVTEIDGVQVAEGKDLKLGYIFDGDGIVIVEEIFRDEEYNFDIGGRSVVIDIGMNIGLASLYFAAREDIEAVYGFEPFTPTFNQATFNFRINEKYAGKIHAHNYGLGDGEKELRIEYSPQKPGLMSTVKSIDEVRPSRKYETQTETIQIKDAGDSIRSILDQYQDRKIIIKCDTEGAEKEIFESLDSSGLLKQVDMVILEYHFSYDIPLMDILRKHGFAFFKQKLITLETGDFGIIRALKSRQ